MLWTQRSQVSQRVIPAHAAALDVVNLEVERAATLDAPEVVAVQGRVALYAHILTGEEYLPFQVHERPLVQVKA